MATTRLMPLHSGKGRTVTDALGRVTDYVENPEKTNGGELVTTYQCNPSIADQEFLFSERQYATITGRERKDNDVIAYHLRQSFRPGEITPELANKIGYDLTMSLTKGKHAFIVCTHVDKHHIHSHIVFNSTALGHGCKDFDSFLAAMKATGVAVSRIQAGQGKNDRTAHRQKQRREDFGRDRKREKSRPPAGGAVMIFITFTFRVDESPVS